jgi:AraC-like DNA-binding protein
MQAVLTPVRVDDKHLETLAAHTQAVERAIEVMYQNLSEPLALADLASAAYLSPFHFNRIFRRLIGVPPGEFLSALRLQRARRLLLTTSLSVTDICFEVGYTSPGSFTTRFTQLVGLSPRHLRQSAGNLKAANQSLILPPFNEMSLTGWIQAPAGFQGRIHIGLFRTPIPQGKPVSSAHLSTPGFYQLHNLPNGMYYLLAAAMPDAYLPAYQLSGEKYLVAKGATPIHVFNGQIIGSTDLRLRPPVLTDPPLVLALPDS